MSDLDPVSEGGGADEVLAIELALGLLEPQAVIEAERRVREEAPFAALFQTWRVRALALLEGREERPPPRVWSAIMRRLPANDAARALRRWQAATGVAAAGALALGATLVLQPRSEVPLAQAPVVGERPAPARPLVAVLASSDRDDVVAVSYDTTTRRVSVLPQRLATGGREAQLWVIPAGGKPVSAGLLVSDDRTELAADRGVAALMIPGATLAVSLEPRGGSRTAGPSGPVIVTGTIARS
jgi:anti-sigma-K factor RskA